MSNVPHGVGGKPRPRRKKKSDRLLNPDATRDEIACDHAVAPFDRAALHYEKIWGIDRLPELVSPETAARYGYAMADLNAAIESCDPEAVAACVNNCIRGMEVMDAEATARGAEPARGDFWEYRLEDGNPEPFHFAVIEDSAEWVQAKDKRPELQFFTMREVAIALQAYTASKLFAAVKEKFPQSEIVKITNKPKVDWKAGGDTIEF